MVLPTRGSVRLGRGGKRSTASARDPPGPMAWRQEPKIREWRWSGGRTMATTWAGGGGRAGGGEVGGGARPRPVAGWGAPGGSLGRPSACRRTRRLPGAAVPGSALGICDGREALVLALRGNNTCSYRGHGRAARKSPKHSTTPGCRSLPPGEGGHVTASSASGSPPEPRVFPPVDG
jgi:hypothetical protein